MMREVVAEVGKQYRHLKTGASYEVLALAKVEATLEWVVVYRGGDGQTWTRPLAEFCDGRFEPESRSITDGRGRRDILRNPHSR